MKRFIERFAKAESFGGMQAFGYLPHVVSGARLIRRAYGLKACQASK